MAGCGGGGSCGLCAPAPTAPTILASDYRGTVPTTQRVRINWYASDWLKASMRIHLLSQRKRRSQRVGSNSGRTENAFDCALRNISICTKYPIPMPITLYMHHKVIKHPSAIHQLKSRVTTQLPTCSNLTSVSARAGHPPRQAQPASRSQRWLRGTAHNECGRPAQDLPLA